MPICFYRQPFHEFQQEANPEIEDPNDCCIVVAIICLQANFLWTFSKSKSSNLRPK